MTPVGHEAVINEGSGALTLSCPCGWAQRYGPTQLLAMVVLHYLSHLPIDQPLEEGRRHSPRPRLGIARSTSGWATDVDDHKAAPYTGD